MLAEARAAVADDGSASCARASHRYGVIERLPTVALAAPLAEDAAARRAHAEAAGKVRRYGTFACDAKTWRRPRRAVAKAESHPGELYPRVGFIVTGTVTSRRGTYAKPSPAALAEFMSSRW